MATEHIDAVNKELLELERFFVDFYSADCYALPPTYTPGLLPFLSIDACNSLQGHGHPTTSFVYPEVEDPESGRFLEDLRERYKQLKAVQDQLRIELTRLRIWELIKKQPDLPQTQSGTSSATAMASSPTSTFDCPQSTAEASAKTKGAVKAQTSPSAPTIAEGSMLILTYRIDEVSSVLKAKSYSCGILLVALCLLLLAIPSLLDTDVQKPAKGPARSQYPWPRR
ncbi:hypothetical protein EDD21DRAFT_220202 [Dissophora ornata]|nr:hypothetical protein BGZ58_002013 [Dissophora ornata]KAI8604393.1 hypothetical protein EDD21DRAFT_220202 [Dissophora ornata]